MTGPGNSSSGRSRHVRTLRNVVRDAAVMNRDAAKHIGARNTSSVSSARRISLMLSSLTGQEQQLIWNITHIGQSEGRNLIYRFTKKDTVLYLDFQSSQHGKLKTVKTSLIWVLHTSSWYLSIENVPIFLQKCTIFSKSERAFFWNTLHVIAWGCSIKEV